MTGSGMEIACARLQGHSCVVCRCVTADGFLPCPGAALGLLTATYPPAAYRRARAEVRVTGVAISATAQPRESAVARGFTGNMCSHCGSLEMRRNGTCEVCNSCGETGGCS